ncbi:MAG: hypothetical protein GF416_05385 [Candidatus Altiarchaeales archaeon]|nr:hypothetical protein [Candidatus Altiarchaeales archaeon]MBD3416550.1 hypothetical protein [Candidatus Altiarchaeales archaeon]
MDKRGQASLEYMVMLALSLVVFSAVLYVTGMLISTSSIQVGVDSAHRAVEKMRSSADFVYVHGHPSRTEINVYMPPNIEEVSIPETNNSIRARVSVGDTYTDIYSVSKGSIYGDLSQLDKEGYYVLRVESTSEHDINFTLI